MAVNYSWDQIRANEPKPIKATISQEMKDLAPVDIGQKPAAGAPVVKQNEEFVPKKPSSFVPS